MFPCQDIENLQRAHTPPRMRGMIDYRVLYQRGVVQEDLRSNTHYCWAAGAITVAGHPAPQPGNMNLYPFADAKHSTLVRRLKQQQYEYWRFGFCHFCKECADGKQYDCYCCCMLFKNNFEATGTVMIERTTTITVRSFQIRLQQVPLNWCGGIASRVHPYNIRSHMLLGTQARNIEVFWLSLLTNF